MGKTIAIYKITVSDMGYLDSVFNAVKTLKIGEVKDVQKIPIGFGIQTIKAAILIPEKQDRVLDEVTDALKKIENVEDVEVENMTLL